MNAFVESILNISPGLAFAIVGCLVFAEDALFIGFLIPGETAAVLGGVVASRGEVALWAMMVVVVLAAVVGDTVGYEMGKRFGPRFLESRSLKRRAKLDKAQDFLRRRGGSAVFLGRFVAFSGPSCRHWPGPHKCTIRASWPSMPPGAWSGVPAVSCLVS